MTQQNNEETIFDILEELSNGVKKPPRKSLVGELLDELMENPNLKFKHPPMLSRTPFITNPDGPILAPKDAMVVAKRLGAPVNLSGPQVVDSFIETAMDLGKETEQDFIPYTSFDLMNFQSTAAFIISIEDSRDYLIRGMRAYFGGTYDAAGLFNREHAAKALYALTEDYLCRRQYWHTDYRPGSEKLLRGTERYDRIMSNFLPPDVWVLPDNRRISFAEQRTRFELDVGEFVRNRIYDRLLSIIPTATYDIHRSVLVPGGVLIERGPDFRVVDWTRRMESGEWR